MTVRKGIPRQGKHRKEPTSGHFVQRSLRDNLSRSCGERANAGTRRRNGAGSLFGENGKSGKRRDYMKSNPYKNLPSLERKPDGTPYRMTPAQRKRANSLIRRECCNCEGGNCIALDDGDTCACPQMISYTVCCKWFRWAVLPLDKALEAEIYCGDRVKRCAVCGAAFIPRSNRAKYCEACARRVRRQQKNASDRKRRWNTDK